MCGDLLATGGTRISSYPLSSIIEQITPPQYTVWLFSFQTCRETVAEQGNTHRSRCIGYNLFRHQVGIQQSVVGRTPSVLACGVHC